MKMVTRKKLVFFFKIPFNHCYFIIENFLPDFLFPSGGLITRDFDRLTRSDRRLTSLRNVAARSGNLIPGLFVGVTQYCVANILIIWTCQVIRDVGIQLIRFDQKLCFATLFRQICNYFHESTYIIILCLIDFLRVRRKLPPDYVKYKDK